MVRFSGKNMMVKLLAVILAMVLWLYVMNEQNPPLEVSFQIPLEVRNLTTNLVITDVPDSVRVKLRGPRSVIAGIVAQDIQCYVDVGGLAEGRHTAKVQATLPNGLEIVEINPDKTMIRLDAVISRQLPVEIRLTGSPPSGFRAGKSTANPARLTVEGPRGLLDSVEKALVTLDLNGKTTTFTANLTPVLINREGRAVEGLTFSPGKLAVTLELLNDRVTKVVEVRAPFSGEPAKGITVKRITIEPDKLELTGSSQLLANIDYVYTEPLSINGLDKNTDWTAKLQLREGVVASKNTVTVHVEVSKE